MLTLRLACLGIGSGTRSGNVSRRRGRLQGVGLVGPPSLLD
jgi:hypothetical protein